jgi:hypothetical protein
MTFVLVLLPFLCPRLPSAHPTVLLGLHILATAFLIDAPGFSTVAFVRSALPTSFNSSRLQGVFLDCSVQSFFKTFQSLECQSRPPSSYSVFSFVHPAVYLSLPSVVLLSGLESTLRVPIFPAFHSPLLPSYNVSRVLLS